MTNPAMMWAVVLRWLRSRPRSVAVIHQYDNAALWFIETRGPLPSADKPRDDWDTCPGMLHQDFETPCAAIDTARWWGYTVIR